MFTVAQIRSLEPRNTPYRLRDKGGQDGLVLQITPLATKTFFFHYKWERKSRYLRLGRFPSLTLARARVYARNACQLIEKGKNPSEYTSSPSSLGSLFDLYIQDLDATGSTSHSNAVRRVVEKEIQPRISLDSAASEFNDSTALEFLEEVSNRKSYASAKKVQEIMQAAFNHAMKHDSDVGHPLGDHQFFGIKINPMHGLLKRFDSASRVTAKEASTYTKKDLIEIFSALNSNDSIELRIANVIRVVLATGGKLSTVLRMQKSDIDMDLGVWFTHQTNDVSSLVEASNQVPLSHYAKAAIEEVLRDNKKNSYVFGQSFSTAPPRLDSIGKILKAFSERSDIPLLTAQKLHQSSLKLLSKTKADLRDSKKISSSTDNEKDNEPTKVELFAGLSQRLWFYDKEKRSQNPLWKKLAQFEQAHRKGSPLAQFEALLLIWENGCLIPDWISDSLRKSMSLINEGEAAEAAFNFRQPSRRKRMELKNDVVSSALERMKEQGYPVNRKTFQMILDLPEVQAAGVKSASTAERLYYSSQNE